MTQLTTYYSVQCGCGDPGCGHVDTFLNYVSNVGTAARYVTNLVKIQSPPDWFTDSVQLRYLLQGTWDQVSEDWIAEARKAIEAFDDAKLEALGKQLSALGVDMESALGSNPDAILLNLQSKAHAAWVSQAASFLRPAELKDYATDYQRYLVDVHAEQVRQFSKAFPERILHPQVIRQAELLRDSELGTSIDLARLTERFDRITRYEHYWENMSDVHVSRLWHADGIQYAHANGVARLQVTGIDDRRRCPVCRRMDGHETDVQLAVDKLERDVSETDPTAFVQSWPFPRIDDIDNISAEAITQKNFLIPFHGRCRCSYLWLSREISVTPTTQPAVPQPPPQRTLGQRIFGENQAAADKFMRHFDEFSKLSLKEMEDLTRSDLQFKSFIETYLDSWQVNTLSTEPTLLKELAKERQFLPGRVRYDITRNLAPSRPQAETYFRNVFGDTQAETLFDEDLYIRFRALNQAYLRKKYPDKEAITIYRGTGGDTGKRAVQNIVEGAQRGERTFSLAEDVLVGYTDDLATAQAFGNITAGRGGIMTTKAVKLEDIWITPEFLYLEKSEREFIIRNLLEKSLFNFKEITLPSIEKVAELLNVPVEELKKLKGILQFHND